MSEHGGAIVVVDVSTSARPDLSTVDVLARLQLTAHRQGSSIRLRHTSPALRGLLDLAGLTEVLPEHQREAEDREDARVEEVRDRGDPTG